LRFNLAGAGCAENYRRLAILVSNSDSGEIVGGLWGETMYAHLHIDLLFIPEQLRRTGLGRRIISDAEAEAIRRGCLGAWLDTYSFQARGFYRRLGYPMAGIIENHPPGHSRCFMKKSFTAGAVKAE
jgi:GNAT superfamily N-acetyltransferase